MVPDGWVKARLGSVAELQRGFDLPSSQRINGCVPIVSSGGVSGYHSEAKSKAPGVVTGRYGSIGDVFYLEEDYWPLNTSLWVKDFHGNHERFIYYLLSNFDFKKFSDKTGVPGVNRNDLHAVRVWLPPIPEQKKIAQILATWDKAITTTEQLLTNSQQQKKALMQQLLTGKKRLLDKNGVKFSGEWRISILGELGDTYSGLTGKTKDDFGKGKSYIPYINIFRNSRIDLRTLEKVNISSGERQVQAKYGDIFFTTSSETPDEVGMSSVLLNHVDELYLNSFCFGFRLYSFDTLRPEYARFIFRSERVRLAISVMGQGATRYNLSKRQLKKLELNLPSVQEQQKIAEVLSIADQEITALQQKLGRLKQEKKALMQQLLNGKRRVVVDKKNMEVANAFSD
ncbi:MAG: restriction endonuclease subunit S [Limnobacter sp.]|jgi:type I restriction enzyme, S subunit|uniref:restriction endonuclease subunit S n=1 Tax=Limnobacter sp. TaxID=2003368 RepID=UPI0012036E4F|nr:restriction endonuclease subunit S [Limnobacter sp.]MDZ4050410.1 restriction endonuclease subunit S [Limnobacter sp.]RZO92976.1 MAG: restriction endonuclease subunit S [Limnobacter sp.]